MAFDTYDNLKTSISNWLARSDLNSFLDDFIDLAEDRLATEMRITGMETDLSVTIAAGVAATPSDFLELKHARIDGDPTFPLEPKDSQWIYRKFPTRSSVSKPEFIGIDGDNFVFGPYPDAAYDVVGTYFAKPTGLSDSNTTNTWTTDTPDALFFACLVETAPFIGNDARIQVWESKYQACLKRYTAQEKKHMLRRGSRVSYN